LAPDFREHFNRAFSRNSELSVAKAGRSDGGQRHILPPTLEVPRRRGQGYRTMKPCHRNEL